MVKPTVGIEFIHGDARQPTQGSLYAVGFDLVSVEAIKVPPFSFRWVPLGFKIYLPPGLDMAIVPRSSYGVSKRWLVHHGTIDPDFADEVKVGFFNLWFWPRTIPSGARIAQAIFFEYREPVFTQSGFTRVSSRGGGFGSTGLLDIDKKL